MDTRKANFKPRLCHVLNFTNTHNTFHRGFSGVTMKETKLLSDVEKEVIINHNNLILIHRVVISFIKILKSNRRFCGL